MYHCRKRGVKVKVFISWSGDRSNKIAETLKKWLKNVIQSIEPFVSSQDVPKGSRWSSDIAKELQDSNFGILCVTKDNFQEPWLLFEAGALSKTLDKSFVVPLLFDVKTSDLQNSPLLQFQATTSFSKEELKKLIDSLNLATSPSLDPYQLEEAFDLWYPKLEESINEIQQTMVDSANDTSVVEAERTSQMIEEILDLSRSNQKLLRNPEHNSAEFLESLSGRLDNVLLQNNKGSMMERKRMSRKVHSMMCEELVHFGRSIATKQYAFLIALALHKDDFPWIYDIGKELMDILKSNRSKDIKQQAISDFKEMLDFSIYYPMKYDAPMNNNKKEHLMYLHEMPFIFMEYFEEIMHHSESDK